MPAAPRAEEPRNPEQRTDSKPNGFGLSPGPSRKNFRCKELVQPSLALVAPGSYISVMKAVDLKVLKNKLSAYVRLAERGETVLVTDRDRVVAEIVPPETTRSPVLDDALLSEAVRKGWITPPALHHLLLHRAVPSHLSAN